MQVGPYSSDFVNKAIELANAGKYEEALIWLDKELEIDNNNLIALDCKSYLFNRLGRDKEALYCYEKARLLDPVSKQVPMGRTHLQDESYDTYFRQCILSGNCSIVQRDDHLGPPIPDKYVVYRAEDDSCQARLDAPDGRTIVYRFKQGSLFVVTPVLIRTFMSRTEVFEFEENPEDPEDKIHFSSSGQKSIFNM